MLKISDIIQLKQELAEKHNIVLHYHDVCPKPFFTLEQTGDEIQNFITVFLKKKKLFPTFCR